jgi:hypothetical protein
MGVHWAEAGIVVKDHEHTKHKHFEGPSYETAVAIGDTASGGQIVMTRVRFAVMIDVVESCQDVWTCIAFSPYVPARVHIMLINPYSLSCSPFAVCAPVQDALLELVNDMGRAHFPVIQCLGLYHINTFDVWLYEVKEHVSRPMHRVFPELRKCEHVWPGTGRRVGGDQDGQLDSCLQTAAASFTQITNM